MRAAPLGVAAAALPDATPSRVASALAGASNWAAIVVLIVRSATLAGLKNRSHPSSIEADTAP
ncbi:MAG: hypothetical protein MUC74_02230 [Ideonella sp.]|jgi:hypothetical protein|nr:hypothetical protein [Ideonella sp.]